MQAHSQRLGSSSTQIEDDLIVLTWAGELLPEDIDGLHARMEEMLHEHNVVFLLLDATRGQALGPEARRRAASWPLAHRVGGIAVFGAGVTVRAMVTIAAALLKVFAPGSAVPVKFMKQSHPRALGSIPTAVKFLPAGIRSKLNPANVTGSL